MKKNLIAAGISFLIAGVYIGLHETPSQSKPAGPDTAKPETKSPPPGAAQALRARFAEPRHDRPEAAGHDRVVLEKLKKITLHPELEKLLAKEGKSNPSAETLAQYLRMRNSTNEIVPEEQREISEILVAEILKQQETALPLIGKTLTAMPMSKEFEEDRKSLMNLVALYPPTENPEISKAALSSLTGAYGEGGGRGPSGENRQDLVITSLQAYLSSTADDPSAANAAIRSAMGGKVDPQIEPVYKGLYQSRFSGR